MADDPIIYFPKEPEIEGRKWTYPTEFWATAAGYICHHTASYEFQLESLFHHLMPIDPNIARILFDTMGSSVGAKCDAILKIAIVSKIPGTWSDELEQNFSFYKSDIAPKRNRIIHDVKIADGDGLSQWDRRAFLKKEGSHQPKTLARTKMNKFDLQDMWNFINLIEYISSDLSSLTTELMIWQIQGRVPRPRPRHPLGDKVGAPLPYNQNGGEERR